MNAEELKKEFGIEFPTEINGYKRPDEPLDSDNDWYIKIPQLIAKDKVLYTGMNLILSTLLSNEKLLKQWHDTLQDVVNAQDWRIVTDSLKGYMTPELKKKLDGIATGANNYVHPSSHPASMITQDATHRLVTDTEKSTWNGKASTAVVSTTANGLAPKRDGEANHFLAGDGAWKTVASATKATQDSNGNVIKDVYLNKKNGVFTEGYIVTGDTTFRIKSKNRDTQSGSGLIVQSNIVGFYDWQLNKFIIKAELGSQYALVPTPNIDDNSNKIANTAFVRSVVDKYAPIIDILKKAYPVGSIYMSTVSTNPATLFGFGTWEAMPAGRVLLAQGTASWGTYNAGSTGGEATHKLTVGEMPSHNHAMTYTPIQGALSGCITGTKAGNDTGGVGVFTWQNHYEIGLSLSNNNFVTAEPHINADHTHTLIATGSNQAHNNIQPYIAVYIWKRYS